MEPGPCLPPPPPPLAATGVVEGREEEDSFHSSLPPSVSQSVLHEPLSKEGREQENRTLHHDSALPPLLCGVTEVQVSLLMF